MPCEKCIDEFVQQEEANYEALKKQAAADYEDRLALIDELTSSQAEIDAKYEEIRKGFNRLLIQVSVGLWLMVTAVVVSSFVNIVITT